MLNDKLYFHIAFISFLSTWSILPSYCAKEECIKGLYHKDKPSQESAEYKFCTPWANLTCCTVQLDNEVYANDSPKKYNQTWHLCGRLSDECSKYWKRQECFYQCSPYVYKWQNTKYKDAIKGVPICASECDNWYQACKDDMICVENILEHLNKTQEYVYECPIKSECKKYSEMYGSGEKLCTKMWGDSYKYVKESGDNCMRFWFDPSTGNPNAKVMKNASGYMPGSYIPTILLLPLLYSVMVFPF